MANALDAQRDFKGDIMAIFSFRYCASLDARPVPQSRLAMRTL